MKIYSRYDLPNHPGLTFEGPTRTQQQFKEEADINNIIAKARVTGYLTDPLKPGTNRPAYGDFSSVPEYHSAQTIIAQANQAFGQMPSDLRKRFNNNPAELLAFLDDTRNLDEAVRLGIIVDPTLNKQSLETTSNEAQLST